MLRVYSSDSCGWCVKLKNYLKSKQVDFNEINVSASEENRRRLIEASGQSAVPVTVFDSGEVVIGFDKEKLDTLLQ